uniref:Uncharacterized protein n=1 Tax=Anguilla anguilla TaxID=7936 RepID=A0A0E9Q9S7_ANGAN
MQHIAHVLHYMFENSQKAMYVPTFLLQYNSMKHWHNFSRETQLGC